MFENWIGRLAGRKDTAAEGQACESGTAKPRAGSRTDFRRMLVDDIGDS